MFASIDYVNIGTRAFFYMLVYIWYANKNINRNPRGK